MEFVNGGELFYHLHKDSSDGFEEDRARFYAAQIVLALEKMHAEGVIYRDLKPENILVDQEGYLRITDFGISKVVTETDEDDRRRAMTFTGTADYMAPEIMQNDEYDQGVDWFSFGVLLYEMLCGKNPLKDET